MFCERNTSISTLTSSWEPLVGVTILPHVLNSFSDDIPFAGMRRYLLHLDLLMIVIVL